MGESLARFFDYLGQNPAAILNFVEMIAALVVIVLAGTQWLSWIRQWGRFARTGVGGAAGTDGASSGARNTQQNSVGRLFTNFLTTIISEFRHLLALLIFLLFAFVLSYGVYIASRTGSGTTTTQIIENVSKVIQAVVASLGGLVGSIIGYYFGESTARTAKKDSAIDAATVPAISLVQAPGVGAQSAMEEVRTSAVPPE